jgi:cyclopropane-fatty-acyl-phospholipid synthase
MEAEAARARRFGYDDAFLRSWRYYLGACARSFALGHTDVVPVELVHA